MHNARHSLAVRQREKKTQKTVNKPGRLPSRSQQTQTQTPPCSRQGMTRQHPRQGMRCWRPRCRWPPCRRCRSPMSPWNLLRRHHYAWCSCRSFSSAEMEKRESTTTTNNSSSNNHKQQQQYQQQYQQQRQQQQSIGTRNILRDLSSNNDNDTLGTRFDGRVNSSIYPYGCIYATTQFSIFRVCYSSLYTKPKCTIQSRPRHY